MSLKKIFLALLLRQQVAVVPFVYDGFAIYIYIYKFTLVLLLFTLAVDGALSVYKNSSTHLADRQVCEHLGHVT